MLPVDVVNVLSECEAMMLDLPVSWLVENYGPGYNVMIKEIGREGLKLISGTGHITDVILY
jgi:hypothetical protein